MLSAHHLVGLAMQTRNPIRLETAFDLVTKAYPFSRVSFMILKDVLIFLIITA